MEYYHYEKTMRSYSYIIKRKYGSYITKKMGSGFLGNIPLVAGYPTYLGVDIFEVNNSDMPATLLGLTNGRHIIIKRGLNPELKEFVRMHEEEHVKDMFATELEIDRHALRRFKAKSGKIGDEIINLLKKRHPHEKLVD